MPSRFALIAGTLAVSTIALSTPAVSKSGEVGPATRAIPPTPLVKLTKTRLFTSDSGLGLTPTAANAFPQVGMGCPRRVGSCTYRVEVSSQFNGVDADASARMIVLLDGSGIGVFPTSLVNVNASATQSLSTATTFTFVVNAAPGPHKIDVRFAVSSGTANAGFRTMTLQLFTP